MMIIYINYNSNLASGSSRESRFSQSVEMMLSYLLGYFLKISFITTTASWTTYVTYSQKRVSTEKNSVDITPHVNAQSSQTFTIV